MNYKPRVSDNMFSYACSSEEDIFETPMTSPSTSRHSLTSRGETIYESATDLTQFSDGRDMCDTDDEHASEEKKKLNIENNNMSNCSTCLTVPPSLSLENDDHYLNDKTITETDFQMDESQHLLSNACFSPVGLNASPSVSEKTLLNISLQSLADPHVNDQNTTENEEINRDKQNYLTEQMALDDGRQLMIGLHMTKEEDILTKQQNGVSIEDIVENFEDRMNGLCADLSSYVPSAMSAISNTREIETNSSPKGILNWLQEKKGNLSIVDFLDAHFNNKESQVNVFKHVQSKIFIFFFLLLCDACNSFSGSFIDENKNMSNTAKENFENWLQEIKLIFEVLLKTSYIHIKFSDINTSALEQPVIAFRTQFSDDSLNSLDFQKSLKEMKQLRKKMAGIPSLVEKLFICVSIIMFLVDIATDIIQTITYHNEGNPMWPLIAAFIIIPSLLGTIVCFAYWRRENPKTMKEVRLKILGMVMIPLQLGEVWQQICLIFDTHFIMDSYTALSLLLMQMLEGLFEGGPQALVQTYVLFGQDITSFSFQNVLHVASPLLSSLSIAVAITNIDFGRLSMTVSFKTKVTFILCRLGEVLARFIVYVGIFYSFGRYGLILIAAQVILLMIPTFIIIQRDHTKRESRDVNCVYLRCRHGGFNAITPSRVFNSNIVRWFVWIAIPLLYSVVPLQRFELDFECNGSYNKRPPFWKCSRHFAMFNLVYAMHQFFNIIGFVVWLIAGSITDHDFLIPLCVLFVAGTLSSLVIRIQSWVGRTYYIGVQNDIIYKYQERSQEPQDSLI